MAEVLGALKLAAITQLLGLGNGNDKSPKSGVGNLANSLVFMRVYFPFNP
jgi:hypothetical protein